MYGFDHIPLAQRAIQVDEFVGVSTDGGANLDNWKEYTVPSSAAFLYVYMVGAGGNGGTPTVGAGVSGGGGGGSGCIVKAIIPTMLIPKSLYVKVGNPGGTTQNTIIAFRVSSASVNGDHILISGTGNNGAAAGTAGTGGGFSSVGRFTGTIALHFSQNGATGGAGSTTNGAAVTALATLPLTGGGGGGGSSAGTGGNITGAGPFPTITGGASGANPGRAGMQLRQPFGGTGGSGGGGVNAAGTGLNFGGAGAIGCGGGGGGNATSGTPGAGGKGGPGYCLIVAF